MSLTFGFYNSLNGDRKYNAEQMSSLFDGVLQDGVFASIGQAMMVTAGTGMQVLVGTGRAWFNHTWTLNDAQMPLDIDASDLILKRIDAVVLEVNNNMAVRTNTIKVIKGTPASTESAAKPAMTNADGVFQHPLAYISVNPAASTITGGDIENVVGKDKETKFVTSICESVSIEDLFSQWTGQFTTWFDNIKAQLEGDVVTNLQRQIDEKVAKADKASLEEAQAGVDDSKWMTPKTTAQMSLPIGSLVYTQNNIELPKDKYKKLTAISNQIIQSEYPDLYDLIGYTSGMLAVEYKYFNISSNPVAYSHTTKKAYYLNQSAIHTTVNDFEFQIHVYDFDSSTDIIKTVSMTSYASTDRYKPTCLDFITLEDSIILTVRIPTQATQAYRIEVFISNDDFATYKQYKLNEIVDDAGYNYRCSISKNNNTYMALVFPSELIDRRNRHMVLLYLLKDGQISSYINIKDKFIGGSLNLRFDEDNWVLGRGFSFNKYSDRYFFEYLTKDDQFVKSNLIEFKVEFDDPSNVNVKRVYNLTTEYPFSSLVYTGDQSLCRFGGYCIVEDKLYYITSSASALRCYTIDSDFNKSYSYKQLGEVSKFIYQIYYIKSSGKTLDSSTIRLMCGESSAYNGLIIIPFSTGTGYINGAYGLTYEEQTGKIGWLELNGANTGNNMTNTIISIVDGFVMVSGSYTTSGKIYDLSKIVRYVYAYDKDLYSRGIAQWIKAK